MRLFIALDVTGSAKGHLEREIERGRVESPDSRWVRSDQLHMTLVFLGSIDASQVGEIEATMSAVARRHGPVRLSPGAGGVFGPGARPSVLFARLDGDVAALAALQGDLARALEGVAPKEERPFVPHLTLARGRHRRGDAGLARALSAIRPSERDTFTASELVLYQSETRPTGAIYVRLAAATLGATP